QIIYLGSNL
ncbi:hypothetical protein CP8484711_1812, partial [Chlamydia psittaci 84-8471/1]